MSAIGLRNFGCFLLLLASTKLAFAWGSEGHRLVAEAAQVRLSARAQMEVQKLLALEPGATLASISTWADEIRSPATAPWHYLNFPRGDCHYDPAKVCEDGNCAVAAIERQTAVLASKAPDSQRLEALKWVVHLAGDLHQPLHGGFADDRGGNRFQLERFGKGTNLHAMWDSGLIKQVDGGREEVLSAMEASHPAVGGNPALWAEESVWIASAEGFYPASHRLSAGYFRRWSGVMFERMEQAAINTVNRHLASASYIIAALREGRFPE